MNSTEPTHLPYSPSNVASERFDHATLLDERHRSRRKWMSVIGGLALIVAGIACFFAMLRILFNPYLLGGPGMVMVAVPLIIVATLAFIFLGTRLILRASRHSHH